MALTPFRWLALAAIGCLLATLAVLSMIPTEEPWWYRGPPQVADTTERRLRDQAGALNQQAQRLAARYRQMHQVDSVARIASRAPDTGAFRVFIGDVYPPATRAIIDKAIRDARSIRRGDAGKVDLFVIHDTAQYIRGVFARYGGVSPSARFALPQRPGDRCRVYLTIGWARYVAPGLSSEKSAEQLLGPCGFYVAFGEPGPRVRDWLAKGGWEYATEGSWTVAPFIPALRDDPRIFKGPSPASWRVQVGAATECIKGRLEHCERAVTLPPLRRRYGQFGGITYGLMLGPRSYYNGILGSDAGELLSDAVRELGRERFRTFWTSQDSVPVAFEKASGERWGAFIQSWMVQHYGPVEPGPRMSSFATITSAILVLIAVGVTMLVSTRRTYT